MALHELTHWTSHPDRCNRQLSSPTHLTPYAFEELIAEMGAAFLSSHCGLPGELQHASYIANWLAALRNEGLAITRKSLSLLANSWWVIHGSNM
jgi:antirestriction protein ArdC